MQVRFLTILIVDDDPTLLRLLGILLREEGHTVMSAESGEAALGLATAVKPDMVLTDLRMGGMDGLELLESLRKMYPMLPGIILTAHGNIPEVSGPARRGVLGFIQKPYEARHLLREVNRIANCFVDLE